VAAMFHSPDRRVPCSRRGGGAVSSCEDTLPLGSNVAVRRLRSVARLPVAVQVPLTGS
jgi:hypothetical protein